METPDTFTQISLSLRSIGLIAWLIAVCLYAIFSFILVYHWRAYATSAAVARLTLIWYFASGGITLAVAGALVIFM